MKRFVVAAVLFFAVSTHVAFAEENPWVGTWKLDMAKSHFIGYTFTYSQTPDGMLHYSEGPAATTTSFRIDGKEYPTGGGGITIWTQSGDRAWKTIHKMNGLITSSAYRELSPDGKTFNMTFDGTQPDGKTFHDVTVFTRVSGSGGMLGEWRSVKTDASVPDVLMILPSPAGTYHGENPGYKLSMEGKLDGSEMTLKGPTVGKGQVLTMKEISPLKVEVDYKEDGKLVNKGVRTLAADGKSFIEVSWTPGKESEETTGFYVKQ